MLPDGNMVTDLEALSRALTAGAKKADEERVQELVDLILSRKTEIETKGMAFIKHRDAWYKVTARVKGDQFSGVRLALLTPDGCWFDFGNFDAGRKDPDAR
jgi:hypothetical protein